MNAGLWTVSKSGQNPGYIFLTSISCILGFYKRPYSDVLRQRTLIKNASQPSSTGWVRTRWGDQEWTSVSKSRTWPAFLTVPIQGISVYVCCRGVTTAPGLLSGASSQIHIKFMTGDNALGPVLRQTIASRYPGSSVIICMSSKLAKNSSAQSCDERLRNSPSVKAFLSCLCSPQVCVQEQVEHVNQMCS